MPHTHLQRYELSRALLGLIGILGLSEGTLKNKQQRNREEFILVEDPRIKTDGWTSDAEGDSQNHHTGTPRANHFCLQYRTIDTVCLQRLSLSFDIHSALLHGILQLLQLVFETVPYWLYSLTFHKMTQCLRIQSTFCILICLENSCTFKLSLCYLFLYI